MAETLVGVRTTEKSTITCDMEGVIETFNDGAAKLFGYSPEEVVGLKRVSLFSPGLIVLQNVPAWLKEASVKGEMTTKTVFVRKDGSMFSAEIRITPTFKDGKQIGFCGVTQEIAENIQPAIAFPTKIVRWLVILRLPFLSASVIPALIAAAYAPTVLNGAPFPTGHFLLALLGVILLHLSANVLNDYFDWISGADQVNTKYFQQYSGGSRSIDLGLISVRGTAIVGSILFATSVAIGLYLWQAIGDGILVFGIAGAFLGFFYTAPPVRLVARHGLGELAIGMAFGPFLTGGIHYVLTAQYSPLAFLLGLPIGLLTSNILLINQVPDKESDAKTGKNHLVVTFGEEAAVGIYAATWILAALLTVYLAFDANRIWMLVSVVALVAMALPNTKYFKEHLRSRDLVKANVNTIKIALVYGVLCAVGLLI